MLTLLVTGRYFINLFCPLRFDIEDMGCGSCSTNGASKGCGKQGGCVSCGKLHVYDWLSDIALPAGQQTYDVVEVRFKNSRKIFFRNLKNIALQSGDLVVVEGSPGYDLGIVSVVGELARIQVDAKQSNFKPNEAKKILRKASQEDVDKWHESRKKEDDTMYRARSIANALSLNMKISDVEYQADGSKATFYYTADERVDFRQLIKDLAESFRVKIEMRQIGARQEAARLGGIGSCGRELCCSTWLTDFRSVSTSAARYQQLSINPQKLAGQCGKLKCCLNYELDAYLEQIKAFPSPDSHLKTEKGKAVHIKTDVFRNQLWYGYIDKDTGRLSVGLVPITSERANEIIELNKKGVVVPELRDEKMMVQAVVEPDYSNVVGQDDLSRFDSSFKKKKKKRKPKRPGQGTQKAGQQKPKAAGQNKPKSGGQKAAPKGQKDQGQKSQRTQKNQGQQNAKPKGEKQGNNPNKKRRPKRNNSGKKGGGNEKKD